MYALLFLLGGQHFCGCFIYLKNLNPAESIGITSTVPLKDITRSSCVYTVTSKETQRKLAPEWYLKQYQGSFRVH